MATVKSIVTKWGFQVDAKPLEKMKLAVAELKTGMAHLAIEAAGYAMTLFAVAETTAHAAKEARIGALQSGMTTDAFQGLAFAAKKAGLDSEGLAHAMGHMNRTIFEAKMGSKEALKSLAMMGQGAYTAALKGAPTNVVFEKMADRIAGIKDPAARAGLAMSIFGRQGLTLLPLLDKGSKGIREMSEEAEEMGLILSEDTIKASTEFSHALHESEGRLLGIKNALGSELLKPMTAVFKQFSAWVKLNRVFITQNISGIFKALGNILFYTLKATTAVVTRLSELTSVIGGLGGAVKYAALGFAVFAGAQILAGIGSSVQALFGLISTFRILSSTSMAAAASEFLAAYALPIAIGIAVAALIALIEDVVGFFQGKESVTGIIVDSFKQKIPQAIDYLHDKWLWLIGKFKSGVDTIKKALTFDFLSGDSDMSLTQRIVQLGSMGANAVQGMTGMGSMGASVAQMGGGLPSPERMPGGDGVKNTQQVQNSITVEVNGGSLDPHALGDRTVDVLQKNHEKLMRETNRAFVQAVD